MTHGAKNAHSHNNTRAEYAGFSQIRSQIFIFIVITYTYNTIAINPTYNYYLRALMSLYYVSIDDFYLLHGVFLHHIKLPLACAQWINTVHPLLYYKT